MLLPFTSTSVVSLGVQAPNPSIERTHNGGAQCLAPSQPAAPLCAAHVKR